MIMFLKEIDKVYIDTKGTISILDLEICNYVLYILDKSNELK